MTVAQAMTPSAAAAGIRRRSLVCCGMMTLHRKTARKSGRSTSANCRSRNHAAAAMTNATATVLIAAGACVDSAGGGGRVSAMSEFNPAAGRAARADVYTSSVQAFVQRAAGGDGGDQVAT